MSIAHILIGLSGYSYKPWQGPGCFYPDGLKSSACLCDPAQPVLDRRVGWNRYRLPIEQTVRSCQADAADLSPCTKAHCRITHLSRLKPETLSPAQLMLDRLAPLAENWRLGPILLQPPPTLDDARLADFPRKLPRDFRWASEFRQGAWNVAKEGGSAEGAEHHLGGCRRDGCLVEHRHAADFCCFRHRRSR